MTWNCRVVRHKLKWKDVNGHRRVSTSFALHEVHYDKKGKITGCTVEPVSPHAHTTGELIKTLEIQLQDAKRSRKAVLNYRDL